MEMFGQLWWGVKRFKALKEPYINYNATEVHASVYSTSVYSMQDDVNTTPNQKSWDSMENANKKRK